MMTLGDAGEASAAGVRVRLRGSTVVAATLMTAAAVSVSGIVGWVGLVVPQRQRSTWSGRSFARDCCPWRRHRRGVFAGCWSMPAARTLGTIELLLGVLTRRATAPCFLVLLARGGRGWT